MPKISLVEKNIFSLSQKHYSLDRPDRRAAGGFIRKYKGKPWKWPISRGRILGINFGDFRDRFFFCTYKKKTAQVTF